MSASKSRLELAQAATGLGTLISDIPWAKVIDDIRRGIPLHQIQTRHAPQISALGLAFVIAVQDSRASLHTAPDMSFLEEQAKKMSLAVEADLLLKPTDIKELESMFAKVTVVGDRASSQPSEKLLGDVTGQGYDVLLTHRQFANGNANKKDKPKENVKTKPCIAQRARTQVERGLVGPGQPAQKSRTSYETPFVVHYNPHTDPNRHPATSILLDQIDRPDGIKYLQMSTDIEMAIRKSGGQGTVIVHGVEVDCAATWALAQRTPTKPLSVSRLRFPESVDDYTKMKAINALLHNSKDDVVELHGYRIDRERSLRDGRKRVERPLTEITSPPGISYRDFPSYFAAELNAAPGNGLVTICGVEVYKEATLAQASTGKVIVPSAVVEHVFLAPDVENFTTDWTDGAICVCSSKPALSGAVEKLKTHLVDVSFAAQVRSHASASINGHFIPHAEINGRDPHVAHVSGALKKKANLVFKGIKGMHEHMLDSALHSAAVAQALVI